MTRSRSHAPRRAESGSGRSRRGEGRWRRGRGGRGRLAFIKVEIFGGNGARLFTNFEKEPSEDLQALFQRVSRDGDRIGVPTWEADGVARDTRLRQHEERMPTYPLPAGAARATARLSYRFVPPPAIEKHGIRPDGTVEKPHLVAEAALELR